MVEKRRVLSRQILSAKGIASARDNTSLHHSNCERDVMVRNTCESPPSSPPSLRGPPVAGARVPGLWGRGPVQ
eukprot:gene16277-biopygen731